MPNYDDIDLAIVSILLLGVAGIFVFKDATFLATVVATIAALARGKPKGGQ